MYSIGVYNYKENTKMCHTIIFEYKNKSHQVFFTDSDAKLPILTKNGQTYLVDWGRRTNQSGNLPLGGLALLDEIYDRRWKEFCPQSVRLPIRSFMLRDFADKMQWCHVSPNKWVQGLLAKYEQEYRVYIVAFSPDDEGFIHWPRVLH